MKTYWNTQDGLTQLTEWQPNCWIQMTCPTEEDQRELEEQFNIPDYFLSDISDTDERARYEYDDHGNWISRKVSMMGREMEQTRKIEYYE